MDVNFKPGSIFLQLLKQLYLRDAGQSNAGETKTMEATKAELGPVRFWSPKSSSFSGSDSIVVEEADQVQ